VKPRCRCSCVLVAAVGVLPGCHDISDFSTTSGGIYEGAITSADFIRAGIGPKARMCVAIDTNQLQSAPGLITTDDGLFGGTPLRPIPQYWQDPLSTFNFGEGRIENALYVAHGNKTDAGLAGDVFVVLSFMVAGTVEVRLLRGAPPTGGSAPDAGGPANMFGVFSLSRSPGSCPF
jgi:hypothetical protein